MRALDGQYIASFLALFFSVYLNCVSQKQANVWYFGKQVGLDFNYEPPIVLLGGKITFDGTTSDLESSASISDENGELLFYTNGVNVWNRIHQIMPNGSGLYGNNTTTQVSIIPKPANNFTFYIFTASPQGEDEFFPVEQKGFRYSVVDMSRSNGFGDIVLKNLMLAPSTTEKIAATNHANGIDIWVVMHEWNNNIFKAFLITENGISNPVISQAGSKHERSNNDSYDRNAMGQMKISPSGEKLAISINGKEIAEVFSFNPSNGDIGLIKSFSTRIENETGGLYGLEFSPNGRYLYLTDIQCNIFQYDLDAKDIPGSKFVVKSTSCSYLGQLQLGPTGKIYVAQSSKYFIGAINKPNEGGELCDYESVALNIPDDGNHFCGLGLPNFISSYFHDPTLYPQGPYFEMPNVFTPNNDGYNDRFVPRQKYNVASFYLTLFNRWGQKIYETTDLENGWNGKEFSPSIYYWIAQYEGINGKQGTQKGIVHLVRDP